MIFGKCRSLEHVFLPDGFKKLISATLDKKKTDKKGPLRWVRYVPCLNFKTCRFTYKRGSYECISLLLSQFEPIFVSFVTIAAVLHHCFKAMSLVRIFTPTGPHNKIVVKCPSFLCNYLLYPRCHHFCNFLWRLQNKCMFKLPFTQINFTIRKLFFHVLVIRDWSPVISGSIIK